MDWRGGYQISLSVVALIALAGALWLVVAPQPSPGVEIIPPTEAPSAAPAAASGEPEPDGNASPLSVNLNSASAAELEELPGVGEVLAARIIAWREENGPFARIDQVMAVSGIGTATYERIRPYARVR